MAVRELFLIWLASHALGLVTLESVREITNITRDCTHEITTISRLGPDGWDGNVGQIQLSEVYGDGDDEDAEDVVAAALNTVDRKLLEVLNVPLDEGLKKSNPKSQCEGVVHDYHLFLASTSQFLYAIHEKQQVHRWGGDSSVFSALAWLQALWASRKANVQNRSFIEQQMTIYSSTGCFDSSQEVLKRDVELVEFMNDLLDSFD